MSEAAWYGDGLRFRCDGCGDCCTGASGYVWVNKAEIEALAAAVGEEDIERFQKRYIRKIGIRKSLREYASGDCVFFDKKIRQCAVYADRPRQCRSWPFWNSNVRTPEAWADTCEVCPGCDKGSLHKADTIQQQRTIIRI